MPNCPFGTDGLLFLISRLRGKPQIPNTSAIHIIHSWADKKRN